jgi:hypothetical protein
VIWRALTRHVKADHRLEVWRLPDGVDFDIYCCWCGGTVLAGSPGVVREIVGGLSDSGAKILDVAPSGGDAM